MVLDPRVAGTAPGDVLFSDARAIPGTGERLAAMGCAAVGVLALPHGAGQRLLRPRPNLSVGKSGLHIEAIRVAARVSDAHRSSKCREPETSANA